MGTGGYSKTAQGTQIMAAWAGEVSLLYEEVVSRRSHSVAVAVAVAVDVDADRRVNVEAMGEDLGDDTSTSVVRGS